MMQFQNFRGRDIVEAAQDTQIRNLTDQNSIILSLRYIFTLTGLKSENLPSELQKMVLVDFIEQNFGWMTPEEIKLAFRMAVAGQLDVDANHYQNFSSLYFANIANAYREKRGAALTEYNRKLADMTTKPRPDDHEKKILFWGFVDECLVKRWHEFNRNGRINWPHVHGTEQMFRAMEQLGFVLTTDQKNAITEVAKKQIAERIQAEQPETRERAKVVRSLRESLESMENPFRENQTLADITRRRCYEISIETFFQDFKTSGRDFAEIIDEMKNAQYEH